MNAIKNRRSIRKYKETPVERELIEKILQAGTEAPSSKNRQPWHFIAAAGRAKDQACDCMEKGLMREEKSPFLPESSAYLGGARNTLRIMRQAPVLIFIVNPLAMPFDRNLTIDERVSEICNAQSVGAAVENMTLAATELGLGSLWICDIFFAQEELSLWAGGELYAVLALGYADESPAKRPRKCDAIEWRM